MDVGEMALKTENAAIMITAYCKMSEGTDRGVACGVANTGHDLGFACACSNEGLRNG